MAPADLLPALPWAVPFLAFVRLAVRRPALAAESPADPRAHRVSVVIPARNEAATIETVVRSALATAHANFEVLVVDDRSTDATAAIVERLAQSDSRLRLVHGADLPPGWYGKPWACVQGWRAATGDVLLFTDADTRHSPMLVPHALGALDAGRGAVITVSPHQRCVTFWERVIMPQIWLLLGVRYHPAAVSRARRARDVIANGQFILMRRSSYETLGTHEAVRHEVAEDLALAQLAHARGHRVWFAFATELMETRMYHDLPHIVEGWSKNLYMGGRRSFPDEPLLAALVPVALGGAMLFWLIPIIILLLTGAGVVAASLAAPALAAIGISSVFWAFVSMGMRIPPWYGPAYPLGALAVLYIIARSTWRGAGKIEWKGRSYGTGDAGVTSPEPREP
ncbi:MAG TPA: glycosyltransferase family 2 protein [Gemmatimonadales bacterium]|nr:glycosyltransferase family 2 protein [Gemmatimonadales bacterium]